MLDCILVGFNDADFNGYVRLVRSMGTDTGGYRDLNLAFVDHQGTSYRSLDLLSELYNEGRPGPPRAFSNSDFLWPVVAYLGHYLHKRGFAWDYVNLFQREKERLRDLLVSEEVLTVAITTTVYVTPEPIQEIIAFVRRYNERAKIVVGGPYISAQARVPDPEYVQGIFKYIGADYYIISSEGEAALADLLTALKAGEANLGKVENLAYHDGDTGYVLTAASTESNPLDEDLIDYRIFRPEDVGQLLSIRTAKSCPFTCSFCGFPQRAGRYNYLPVEKVEQLLDHLAELGSVNTLTFLDDTFNVPKKRFKEILRMMIRKGYGFRWNSFYRSDHGDPETIELMAAAGCEGVFLGTESGSDLMLQRMNKTSRRHHYLEALPLFREAGILAHTNFIVGFPGETADTVQETIDFIEEGRPATFKAQLWYADPITPIWDEREEYRISEPGFGWRHGTMDFRAACDWIDTLFLRVEGSLWLPQWGFEQWSMFYLQRLGMPLERVTAFMRTFNAAVREKLLDPSRTEVSPQLMETLRACSQFDRPGKEPDLGSLEVYSAEGYGEAERFWHAELRDAPSASLFGSAAEGEGSGGWRSRPSRIDPARISAARQACRPDAPETDEILLAAYGALLARLNGRDDIWLLVAGRADVLPLRLASPWDRGFRACLRELRSKAAAAGRHRLQASHILRNGPRLAQEGCRPPRFEAAFLSDGDRIEPSAALTEDLALLLSFEEEDGRVSIAWRYREGRLDAGTVEALDRHLGRLLEDAATDPDAALGGGEESESGAVEYALQGDAAEAFNF